MLSRRPTSTALAWGRGWRRQLPDARDTRALAAYFAAAAHPPQVVAVVGEMGAGKTAFVRALAAAWGGVDMDEVASPTYSLMHVYAGHRGPLVHIDLWRVADLEAAAALGLEEAIAAPDGVVLVEWADRLPGLLPAHAWGVRLEFLAGGGRRACVVGPPPEDTDLAAARAAPPADDVRPSAAERATGGRAGDAAQLAAGIVAHAPGRRPG